MNNFDRAISQSLCENLKEQSSIGFKETWNAYSRKRYIFRYKLAIYAAASLLILIGSNYYAYTKGIWFSASNMKNKFNNGVITSSSSAALLIWDDEIYYISVLEVPYDNIGKEIGKITSKKNNPMHNGESNLFFPGTKLYKIKDMNAKHLIAIKDGDKYLEAHTEHYLKSIR